MSNIKINRALAKANIPQGAETRKHLLRNVFNCVNREVFEAMTSKQMAAVLAAANYSYHQGKADAGASIEGDSVWVGGAVNRLIAIKDLPD